LPSQAGLESATTTGAATATASSGEHEISFASLGAAVTRGRVWANVVEVKTARAKPANRTRGNSF